MFQLHPHQINNLRQFAQQHCPSLCTPRPIDSHKGSLGTLGIIGGAKGMTGAPLLAATAALFTGCGKIFVGFNQEEIPLAVYPTQPELMLQTAENVIKNPQIDTWLIGCGLSQNPAAQHLLHHIIQDAQSPFVLDADALRLLPNTVSKTTQAFIITPHAAEAAHLLNTDSTWINTHRVQAAQALAAKYHCIAILKGRNSIIANENHILMINPSGNAGLASAGTGDTLSGIIASLLAQKIPVQEAAIAAVWLHGLAADVLADQIGGNIGISASELPKIVRFLRNRLIESPPFFRQPENEKLNIK